MGERKLESREPEPIVHPHPHPHTSNPPVATILLTHAVQNFSFQVIDMAGAKQYREIWKQHFPAVNGIIFVVDSADKFRIASVVDELEMILEFCAE